MIFRNIYRNAGFSGFMIILGGWCAGNTGIDKNLSLRSRESFPTIEFDNYLRRRSSLFRIDDRHVFEGAELWRLCSFKDGRDLLLSRVQWFLSIFRSVHCIGQGDEQRPDVNF